MGRTFDKGVLVSIGLVVALLVVNAGLAYRNTRQLLEDTGWVAHTHEVLDLTADLLRTLVDAETGQRGFLITGKDDFLEPYRQALARLDRQMQTLTDKTRDNPRQQARIEELKKLTAADLTLLQEGIDLRRRSAEEGQAFIATGKAKEQMDAIRRLVATMEQEEHDLLRDRERQSGVAYRNAVTTELVAAAVGLGLVGALVYLVRRSLNERTRAAALVREQRERLHTTLTSIGDAVIVTDAEGRVILMNPVAQAMTGWKDGAAGRPVGEVFRIVNEQTRQPVESPVPRVIREGVVVGLANHTALIARDGTEVPIDDSGAPIRNAEGEILGVVLVFRNVSERRRLEVLQRDLQHQLERQVQERTAELRASEERFRLLVEGTQDYAIFLLDPEGRVVSWNPGAERIKGYRADEIIGRHFSRFYSAEEVERGKPEQELKVAAAEGKYEEEGWRVRKDGCRFWASVVITALHDEAGKLRGFSKITRDLTEKKQAEESTRRLLQEQAARRAAEEAERQLREQREWLRVTLDSIGDAVITTDTEGRITYLNPVAQALTGWGQEQAQGQPLEAVFPILHEQTRRPVENPVAKVIREGVIVGLGNHTVLIARDGTERPIDDSAAPIRNDDGGTVGVVLTFRDVTAQRQAQVALRQSEARKTAILDTALDGIITIDHQGKVIEYNPAAERTFGYRRADVLGRDLAELIIPLSFRERYYQGLAHYLATGKGPMVNKRIEMPALRADGSEFPVEVAITPIRTQGAVVFTAYLRDLTEQKKTEHRRNARLVVTQVLAQSAALGDAAPGILRAVCESLGWDCGLLWSIEPPAGVLRCEAVWHKPSVRVEEFAAVSRERTFAAGVGLPGRVWASGRPAWIPDVGQDANFPRAPVARREGLRGAFGCPILFGTEILGVIEFFSHEIREPDADLLEMMATVGGQIGQFVERRWAEQALRDSEQRFARFMQHLPGLAWIKDLQGRYVYVNDAAEKAFRTPRAELSGKTDEEVFPPETAARFKENDQGALDSGTGVQVIETLEHADGIVHHSLVSKFPILGPDGQAALVGGMAIDVTDRLRAEEALKEADRRKDEFLAMLAHELRNPLAPIRNALHIMKQPGVAGAVVERVREMMERQVQHMSRMVDDLLDVSRITRGKIELRKEGVDLASVVSRTVEATRPLIEDRRQELTVDLPPEPVHLEADPTRLEQVLANLLNNAAKYTDQGGHIWLSARQDGGELILRVKDTGMGLPADMLSQIFEPFVQSDRVLHRSQGGLGIGLTLVRSLVEMHGGSVQAHSDGPGKGSEFIVRLPALRHQEKAGSTRAADGDKAAVAATHRRRILVVDDNVDAAESLALLLRLEGHDVRVAHDGPAALAAVEADPPDAVLLDIGMPAMNGYDVAQRLRQRPGLENLLLVAMTGWGQEEDRRRSREAGFDRHLVKPADPEALRQLLAHP